MTGPVIVLATENQGKIREIKDLLAERPVTIMGLSDFGPTPKPFESADSFEDNAYLKASFYARILGFPAIADDSGLAVDALGGAPGVHSARYAGEGASDRDRITKLLKNMENAADRKAAFVTAVVLAVPQGPALTWVGRCEGEITRAPEGEGGFGYDPIFFHPPTGRTFAQLSLEEKNRVSHRGQAFREMAAEFDKVLVWLKMRLEEARPPHPHQH
ncbi:MAG: XTP/dITP diphosphatase [Pseudomonadota bacterium]